jgi:hypothetical protein
MHQKPQPKAEKYADSLYQQLSLDEKIGQLYIVAFTTIVAKKKFRKLEIL